MLIDLKKVLPTMAVLALTAACSDTGAPTAVTPQHAPVFDIVTGTSAASYVVSQGMEGDTTVTVFVVGTDPSGQSTFDIGNASKIDFPNAAKSICDLSSSSYGAGTWDDACTAESGSVRITAKSWINARGRITTDFQPAMRFVPGQQKSVTLTLKDAADRGAHIDYCTPTTCINEGLVEPVLTTVLDKLHGRASRVIKHFSGYTVTAD